MMVGAQFPTDSGTFQDKIAEEREIHPLSPRILRISPNAPGLGRRSPTMTEESLFAAALERENPDDRAAFLGSPARG